MIKLLLFLVSFGSNPGSADFSICLGERCTGDKISVAYLEKNHVLTCNQNGFTVESFSIAFNPGDGTILDIQVKGNDLAPVLPKMQTIQSGSKLYLDDIVIWIPDGTWRKAASVFTIE